MAEVVRIRRSKGEIVQDCDVYIGRQWHLGGWKLPKSKWANPFPVKNHGRSESLRLYEEYIRSNPELMSQLDELEGKILGCWCKPEPCHGDILMKLLGEKEVSPEEVYAVKPAEDFSSKEDELSFIFKTVRL